MLQYDLIVVGGGPGGYVAAIRASQLGKKTALIERERVGGVCLNHGCIPTKTLYRTAEVLSEVSSAASYGVHAENASLDLAAARARKQSVVDTLVSGVQSLLKANGVDVIPGEASFTGAKTLAVGSETYTAGSIVLATGSKTAALPIEGIGLDGVLDSTAALRLDEIPKSLVIIGGGVIGAELAGIYRAFGAEVTIVEFLPAILSTLDGELAKFAAKRLAAQGVRILTATKVTKIQGTRGNLTVTAEGEKGALDLACSHVLSCAGRVPNTGGLKLEAASIAFDRKGIKVDENYQTNVPGVYAIGDVTGRVMLAHVASEEGRVCVERICGLSSRVDYALVPSCVFAYPELSSIGKTEEQLKAEGIDYVVSRFQFAGNGKALSLGETEGFVKMLAKHDLSEILGVHIAGAHASDLIAESAMAMKSMLTVEEAANTMRAHPTLSEAVMECTQRFLGEAIHVPPKKKL
ncbi:MAG: dihydrolipoyl dehydrogenase [Clostridiaceae bacterium]